MDPDLKEYLLSMEQRLVDRIETVADRIEAVETKLLSAFYD